MYMKKILICIAFVTVISCSCMGCANEEKKEETSESTEIIDEESENEFEEGEFDDSDFE